MKKYFYGFMLFFCAAASAWAQARPVVEVIPVIREPRPHLLPQRVGVGNCYGLPTAQQTEELATIKISIPGPWERTAEHLAKEKAGEIGANCLFPLKEAGEDNMRSPVQRVYKALRVTILSGPYQVPASPGDFPKAPPATAGIYKPMEFQPLKPPAKHSAHLGWLNAEAVEKHEVIINTAGIAPEVWRDILLDVKEFFPEAETGKLQQAGQSGAIIRIDLIKYKVDELKPAGRDNFGKRVKERQPGLTLPQTD